MFIIANTIVDKKLYFITKTKRAETLPFLFGKAFNLVSPEISSTK